MDSKNDKLISELFLKMEIPVVTNNEIKAVCDVAANYLPNVQRKVNLWEIIRLEVSSISLLYWAICAAIMVCCSIIINCAVSEISVIGMITVVSPIPLLLSIIEFLKNRNPAVSELEQVCKYNIGQLYVIKLMIGLFCNLVVLSFITIFTAGHNGGALQLMLTGSTVMFFLGFIVLEVICKVGKSLPVMGILAGWIFVSSIFFSNENELVVSISRIQLATLTTIFVFSIALFICGLYVFAKQLKFLKIGDIEL